MRSMHCSRSKILSFRWTVISIWKYSKRNSLKLKSRISGPRRVHQPANEEGCKQSRTQRSQMKGELWKIERISFRTQRHNDTNGLSCLYDPKSRFLSIIYWVHSWWGPLKYIPLKFVGEDYIVSSSSFLPGIIWKAETPWQSTKLHANTTKSGLLT